MAMKTKTCYNKNITLKLFRNEEVERMPNNEKEYNGYLLDQLELIERLEMVIEDNNIEAVKKQLALEKKFVERKLYQKPPIRNE